MLQLLAERIANNRYAQERMRIGASLALQIQHSAPAGWAMVFFLAWGKIPLRTLYPWLAAFAVGQVVCVAGLMWLQRRKSSDHITLLLLCALAVLDALLWVSLSWFGFGHDVALDYGIMTIFFIVVALNAPSRVMVLPALRCQLLAVWLCTMVYCLSHLSWEAAYALMLGMTAFLVLMAFLSRRLGNMLGENIQLKLDNQDLATSLRLSLQEVERQATTDALTGTANRRAFDAAVEKLSHGERSSDAGPVSFIALDLDHFKQVNDRFGHTVGDEALRAFAERVRAQLRPSDILARVGGEEFVALVQGVSLEEAVLVANRICLAVKQTPLVVEPALTITASIGVAHYDGTSETIYQTLARADDALYLAKRNGRDQVHAAAMASS